MPHGKADVGCMTPSRLASGANRVRRRPSSRTLFGAGLLLLAALPAAASWTPAAVGSWMVIERWEHGLGPKKVTTVTTTLLNRDRGRFWFEHINDQGQRWEDADSCSVSSSRATWASGGRDEVQGRENVRLDKAWVPCRVILNEVGSKPFSPNDPVSHWITRSKRWETVDTTMRLRVLKAFDLGTEIHYRDGRVEKHPGKFSLLVKTLHENVRIHGHAYDCWVQEWKSLGEDSAFAGRTTVWGCETTPAGWVRQITETRAQSKSGFTRTQQQLADYHFN